MAKRRNKKTKNSKRIELTVRNWAAVKAQFKTSGGAHQDRRTRRNRTRASQNRKAIAESS